MDDTKVAHEALNNYDNVVTTYSTAFFLPPIVILVTFCGRSEYSQIVSLGYVNSIFYSHLK